VAEVLCLITLAPDITEAILVGRQPRQLNLQTLRGRIDSLPPDWAGQRAVLGFAAAGKAAAQTDWQYEQLEAVFIQPGETPRKDANL
jgi:hypothetical protein